VTFLAIAGARIGVTRGADPRIGRILEHIAKRELAGLQTEGTAGRRSRENTGVKDLVASRQKGKGARQAVFQSECNEPISASGSEPMVTRKGDRKELLVGGGLRGKEGWEMTQNQIELWRGLRYKEWN